MFRIYFLLKKINREYIIHKRLNFLRSKFKCFIDSKAKVSYDFIEDLHIDPNVYISDYCNLIMVNRNKEHRISKLVIGENTSIGEFCDLRAAGA